MKNIFLFGECMIELMNTSSNTMKQSFAGDVFNTAVYLKRTFSDANVQLVTAVGKDKFSLDMIQFFKNENIGCDLVFQSESRIPGLYSIQLDDQGERSFTYWRENAAARKVMQHIDDDAIAQLSKGDIFFFSGISLAIVADEDRASFWRMLETLKAAGVKIGFDLNYRPKLWKNREVAQQQFLSAFAIADILLPGVDDMDDLFQVRDVDTILSMFKEYDYDELILKNGADNVVIITDGEQQVVNITPVNNVVDTTSAGDSFNGGYLGARLAGKDCKYSVEVAAKVAGTVIQHPGAIIPKDALSDFEL